MTHYRLRDGVDWDVQYSLGNSEPETTASDMVRLSDATIPAPLRLDCSESRRLPGGALDAHANEIDEVTGPAFVSTGRLPPAERVDMLLAEAYARFETVDEGKVADYIPALARTPRNLFRLCVVETNGAVHTAGDTQHQFFDPEHFQAFRLRAGLPSDRRRTGS